MLTVEEVLALLDAPPPTGVRGQRDRASRDAVRRRLPAATARAVPAGPGRRRPGRWLRVFGKGSRERMALLGGPWEEAMRRYLAAGRPWLASQAKRPTDAVFLNRRGGRLGPRSVQRIVAAYGRGIGSRRRHAARPAPQLRHAPHGRRCADMRSVQELLGHKNLQTTEIYTHVSQTQVRDALLAAHPHARCPRAVHPAARVAPPALPNPSAPPKR
ncbi:MAG: tyrosine-type recombinase/integrase [Anaerolineae bacterium]